jgi:pyruvate/2-oxoglutarate dehydrogenase complex dihydrolipoamide dehydrogenase (E3) component
MAYDLIVIGGGSGGLIATSTARILGARVLLLEKRALGGDCLFTGCVPSKALIRAAEVAHLTARADAFGLAVAPARPSINGAQVMAAVKCAIERVGELDSPERYRRLGAEVRIARPRFVSPDALDVGGETLRAHRFVVATGSHPTIPPIEGLAAAAPLTNETIFDLDAIPPSLAVLGGGPVGLELAQALARLGARVTVLEALDRLLPREDVECSAEIRARLEAEGLTVHTGTRVKRVELDGTERVLACERAGAPVTVRAAALLSAIGRAPNVDGLGLEAAGVRFDSRKILVDDTLRTSNRRVYAVGDVIGRFPFTHMAGYEGALAARNALLPLSTRADYRVVPWATFTAPEVARVGLTEEEARATLDGVVVLRSRFADVDRAITDGTPEGFVKLVTARGRLVGAHIVGARAAELIHPAVLAMRERLPLRALASMTWVYPTLSEGLRKAAQSRYQSLLERAGARRVIGVLRRIKSF